MVQHADRYLSERDVLELAECAGIELAPDALPGMTAELNSLIGSLSPLAAYSEQLPCEGERDLYE